MTSDLEQHRILALPERLDHRGRGLAVSPASDTTAPVSLSTPADVLALLERAAGVACGDRTADPLDRARTLGMLAGVALKALEARDLTARVEALERHLKLRRASDERRRPESLLREARRR